jgi:hypothetical protein
MVLVVVLVLIGSRVILAVGGKGPSDGHPVTVQGWSKGEYELEGLVILDRLTRKGPGAGRDQEREVCCYRDSSGLTQGWRDGTWISY